MFDDRSPIRRVNRESIIVLGGGRALLMQLAHPSVAAGISEHSKFRGDRFGRLLRTLRPGYAILFGTPGQAAEAARRMERRHATVAGPGYRASDPELQMWVHATLIDSALVMYSRFVHPLSCKTEAAYYADSLRVGDLLGIPRAIMPSDIGEFRRYLDGMLAELVVTDIAHGLARELFAPRPLPAAPLFLGARQLTAGLLPPALREQYGLSWGPRRQAALNAAERVSRATWPRLPRAMRRPPWFLLPRGE